MSKGLKRPALSMLVLCIFLALAVGSSETQDTNRVKETLTPSSSEKVSSTVTAKELYSEYKENEVAADKKYKDQIIEVSGEIENIGKDIANTIYITLKTGETLGNVQVMFSDEYEDQVAQLSKGQKVTVRGVCSGLALLNVLVKGGILVGK